MRVITTCAEKHLDEYASRWLESRKNWPDGTEFRFYTEGFEVDCPSKDLSELQDFVTWKSRHSTYIPPSWPWDVVKWANKVFAACDAFAEYDGIGVWIDADCVTYRKIPKRLIEDKVKHHYLALYQRTGMYSETGLWIVDCAHKENKAFFEYLKGIYLSDRFKMLSQWHDCMAMDATVRKFMCRIEVNNLSGDFAGQMHPQALSDLGRYIDHCKGRRKTSGVSPENKFREAA